MVKEALILTLEGNLIWFPPPTSKYSSTTVLQAQLHVGYLVTYMYITKLNNSETTTSLFVSFLPALCVNYSLNRLQK